MFARLHTYITGVRSGGAGGAVAPPCLWKAGPSYYTRLVIDTAIGVGDGPFGPATLSCRNRRVWLEIRVVRISCAVHSLLYCSGMIIFGTPYFKPMYKGLWEAIEFVWKTTLSVWVSRAYAASRVRLLTRSMTTAHAKLCMLRWPYHFWRPSHLPMPQTVVFYIHKSKLHSPHFLVTHVNYQLASCTWLSSLLFMLFVECITIDFRT